MQVKWNVCGHDYFRYSCGICDKGAVSACSSVFDELWVVIREWQAPLSSYVFMLGKECVSLTFICCFTYLFCSVVCFWAFSLLPWHNPNDLDGLQLLASETRTWRDSAALKTYQFKLWKLSFQIIFAKALSLFSRNVWGILFGFCLSY